MPDQPVDPAQPEPHSPGMEGRVSRLETFVEAMRGDIADIRQELRTLRTEMRNEISSVRGELSSMRGELATNFRWLVGLLLTLMLAMIGGFAAVYTQIATILARLPK
jgi:hypothetical protein